MRAELRLLRNSVAVLELAGALVCPHCREEMRRLITHARTQGARHLVLDLRQVTVVNATGIGHLLFVRRLWDQRGGSVRVVSPGGRVCSLINLSHLERFFPWYPSVRAATAGLLTEHNLRPSA